MTDLTYNKDNPQDEDHPETIRESVELPGADIEVPEEIEERLRERRQEGEELDD